MNSKLTFWLSTLALLLAALAHSMWATSLDGFTIDEAYHIAAGASYLRWGDFRVNPEHPPLVKLAAGLAATPSVLHLAPLAIFHGKEQERTYTESAVFVASDARAVQRRARAALYLLNLTLMLIATVVLRRLFGGAVALGTLLLLALEPTVSAHMPVVMTDLPMALLGLICCCLALLVVRDGRWRDWLWLGLACGLLLGTKHSAPLILLPVLAICILGGAWRVRSGIWHPRHIAGLLMLLLLSTATLWALYGFRYYETPVAKGVTPQETFNRPLDLKIADLHSPLLKRSLTVATRAHLLPRAYLWGLADTLRAGVEGRPYWVTAFGQSYHGKAPFWVPFAFLGVKAPIGFLVLLCAGVWLLLTRRLPPSTLGPLAVLGATGLLFMTFIGLNGVYYAGLRHWLFAVPLMAVFAAVFVAYALRSRTNAPRWVAGLSLAAIALSVLPQRRIWEYHNELVGGSANAWRWFDNESVDLGQRTPELMTYFKAHIAPDKPMIGYWISEEDMRANRMVEWNPTPEQVGDGHISGWIIVSGPRAASRHWHHAEALRDAVPVQSFGSLLIYHGTFYMPAVASGTLIHQAIVELHKPKADAAQIEALLLRGAALQQDVPHAHVLLGNYALARDEREKAIQWYRQALPHVDPQTRHDIEAQIARISAAPAGQIAPMRDPFEE